MSEILEQHQVPVIREISVFKGLLHVKRTTTGPDDLPFWFWEEFALVLTHILNVSWLHSKYLPFGRLQMCVPFVKRPIYLLLTSSGRYLLLTL